MGTKKGGGAHPLPWEREATVQSVGVIKTITEERNRELNALEKCARSYSFKYPQYIVLCLFHKGCSTSIS